MSCPAFLTLPDGARLAYELLGSEWLGNNFSSGHEPIVLIGGVGSLRGDWERLAKRLALVRPVLVFDHRGIGDSTYSTPAKDDALTIESMARDLLFLLQTLTLGPQLALCGFSMGGTVTQQLLLLPYLSSNPTALPFKVTHVFLTGTFHAMWEEEGYGVRIDRTPITRPLTDEEKKARARPMVEASFDPVWVADPSNQDRLNWWLDRQIVGRPLRTIINQMRAVARMNLSGYEKLPQFTQFLIIHGEQDAIVPFASGKKLLQVVPWSKFIEVGSRSGQVPNLAFGHHWWEYFDIEVWTDVMESFLSKKQGQPSSRL